MCGCVCAGLQEQAAPTCEEEGQQLKLRVQVIPSIDKVSQEEWDAVVSAQAEVNPFLKWSFLHALEVSGSAVSSWQRPCSCTCATRLAGVQVVLGGTQHCAVACACSAALLQPLTAKQQHSARQAEHT